MQEGRLAAASPALKLGSFLGAEVEGDQPPGGHPTGMLVDRRPIHHG